MNRFPSRIRHYSDKYLTINAERLLLAFQHDMDRNEAESFAQGHVEFRNVQIRPL